MENNDLQSSPPQDEHVACTCPECASNLMNSNTESDVKYWRAAGRFFGYPECCTEEFLKNATTMTRTTGIRAEAAREGFVPCEKHSRELLDGTVKYEDLILNRLCPLPFGYDRMYDPYVEIGLRNAVVAIMSGIVEIEIIKTALDFMHKHTGQLAMLKCEEHYEKHNHPAPDPTGVSGNNAE